jgi:hypothetical protein
MICGSTEAIYLIVPALPQAATGDAVLLRPNQCRGPHFARDPQKSATGTAPQATGKPAAKQNSVTVSRA